MTKLHGGDGYNYDEMLDYSINVNPLGAPKSVIDAIRNAADRIQAYPSYGSVELRKKLADKLNVPYEFVHITAGASEAFMAIAHGGSYENAAIKAPSFYGYEYALKAAGSRLDHFTTDSFHKFKRGYHGNAVFMANPNNPDGEYYSHDKMMEMVEVAKDKSMDLIVDECFLTLAGRESESLVYEIAKDPVGMSHVIVVRSFTKTFAIPGARIGYFVCSNEQYNKMITSQLIEWNASNLAQAAAMAALDESGDYIDKAVEVIRKERPRLVDSLKKAGYDVPVFKTDANYIFFRGPKGLKEEFIKKGIFIRDCSNYYGLKEGDYRIAVRDEKANTIFIKALEK